ncbi:hypothetical protein [Catenuloplanes indicus]|uniref:UDP:flavonoid glycosyltransferase YjiC (YdhE family) n=1 Tax=Catenuloplanes indicus TaxID=137267 RepID=A0AAE4B1X0_9ACTN|nr:hypothetical protein [Catenuloplanes indicus]MDQ0370051.1 UDP:flavonoid glycosyltransferase YjiC (YdhE family) [Catenuloplanes indicus]
MKIIVAAPPIPGETLPLLQLAAALSERGHRVTVRTGPPTPGSRPRPSRPWTG